MYTIDDIEIFIPTFNRPNFLDESLNSLIKQTAGIPKITVFNNGTMHEVSDVIKKYEQYGVTEVKSHGGLLECMDNAEKYLTKKYIMFFHDDDILNSNYIEYAIKALNTYDNIVFITTRYVNFTNYDQIDFTPAKEEHYFFEKGEFFSQYMYINECIAMQTAIYNSNVFVNTPRESNKYGKFFDWPYLVKLSQLGNTVLFSDKKIFNVRIHTNQWTWDKKSSWTIDYIVNWHKQFFEAMKAYKYYSYGYFIFYSKFYSLFKSGYDNLISDNSIKSKYDFEKALECAYELISINSHDINYNKPDMIKMLQEFSERRFYCRKFGDCPSDNDIKIVDYILYNNLIDNDKTYNNITKFLYINIIDLLRYALMSKVTFGKMKEHYKAKYRNIVELCKINNIIIKWKS